MNNGIMYIHCDMCYTGRWLCRNWQTSMPASTRLFSPPSRGTKYFTKSFAN